MTKKKIIERDDTLPRVHSFFVPGWFDIVFFLPGIALLGVGVHGIVSGRAAEGLMMLFYGGLLTWYSHFLRHKLHGKK